MKNEIEDQCKQAKYKCFNGYCPEIETMRKTYSDNMYKRIKILSLQSTGNKKSQKASLKKYLKFGTNLLNDARAKTTKLENTEGIAILNFEN